MDFRTTPGGLWARACISKACMHGFRADHPGESPRLIAPRCIHCGEMRSQHTVRKVAMTDAPLESACPALVMSKASDRRPARGRMPLPSPPTIPIGTLVRIWSVAGVCLESKVSVRRRCRIVILWGGRCCRRSYGVGTTAVPRTHKAVRHTHSAHIRAHMIPDSI